jgi:PTS system nitrogen regulatory IIA component
MSMPALKSEPRRAGRPDPSFRQWIEQWRLHHPVEECQLKTIADLLQTEDIVLDLDVATKSQLFEEIGRHMEGRHGMPQAWVVLSLSRREEVGSTGLGEGVAIPHARIKDLNQIRIAYFRLASPIPFASPDGKPVSDILVLLVPKQATEEHLSILADATRMFSDSRFREHLHLCAQSLAVQQLFATWPQIS